MTTRKNAVISGAAHGIGRAVADEALERGYDVLALDTDGAELERFQTSAPVGRVEVLAVNVADTEPLEDFAREFFAERSIDLLVNNVGGGIETPFFETEVSQWEETLAVTLGSVYRVTRALWNYLRRPDSAVINVSSVHGSRPLVGQAGYAAAKGGLENLTRSMALDAAPYGIRVNAVAPGFVRTRRWTDWFESEEPHAQQRRTAANSYVPLGRAGEPLEIAQAVLWLGGPESSYITGVVLSIDGGLAAQAFPRIR